MQTLKSTVNLELQCGVVCISGKWMKNAAFVLLDRG